MNTTTTAQVRCGNHGAERVYHDTSADVRACYQGRNNASSRPAAPSQPTGPSNADEAHNEGIRRLAAQRSPFFRDRNMGGAYPASQKQVNFITDLVTKYMISEGNAVEVRLGEAILAELPAMSSETAKATITALLKQKEIRLAGVSYSAPAKAAPTNAQRVTLIEQVMAGAKESNFAIIDGDGKARFYRISKRGQQSRRPGTWKIQERVTDMLLPRADSMLIRVCQDIIDQGGAKAAGQRFAQLMHKCYKCGASLTDTTGNPYYAMGLGPECGAK